MGDPGSIPGSGSSLEKEKATHSSTLAWEIQWTEEPGVHGVAKSQTRLSDFTQGWDWGMTTMSTRDLWDDGHVLKLDDISVCFKYDFEILGRQGGKKESNIGYRILFLKAEEAI